MKPTPRPSQTPSVHPANKTPGTLVNQVKPEPGYLASAIHQLFLFTFITHSLTHSLTHSMIYIFLTILISQVTLILLLLLVTELREPLVFWLDGLKTNKAQLVVKSVGSTLFIIMIYDIYTLIQIRRRFVNSPDHVYRILEASLIGFSLFLLLVINNLHQYKYIREVVILTNNIQAIRKQTWAYEGSRKMNADVANSIRQGITRLKTEISKLDSECNSKEKVVQSKKAKYSALKDQCEGILVEYDCLLAYNDDIRDQLRDINGSLVLKGSERSKKQMGPKVEVQGLRQRRGYHMHEEHGIVDTSVNSERSSRSVVITEKSNTEVKRETIEKSIGKVKGLNPTMNNPWLRLLGLGR